MKRKILSILLIIFMLSASLITIPVNARTIFAVGDMWLNSWTETWFADENEPEGIIEYATLDDYLSEHYVFYDDPDTVKSEITTLFILGKNKYDIKDLSGLYEFTNLEELSIEYPVNHEPIKALDFSRLTNLKRLNLDGVDINGFDFNKLTGLEELSIIGTEYNVSVDFSELTQLIGFQYNVLIPGETTNVEEFVSNSIIPLITPIEGYDVYLADYWYLEEEGLYSVALGMIERLNINLSTDKTAYKVGDRVTATINWDKAIQATNLSLKYSSTGLEFVGASIGEDYYQLVYDGMISVNWASLDETDLQEMKFEFNALTESNGDFVFTANVINSATGELDTEFAVYGQTEVSITIDEEYWYFKDGGHTLISKYLEINTINEQDAISGFTLTDNKLTVQNLLDEDLFKTHLSTKVYDNNAEVTDTTTGLGTDYEIRLYDGEELVKELNVVVYGDVTGDGEIAADDALTLIRICNGKIVPTVYAQTAGNVFEESLGLTNEPSAIDALAIIKHLNGKYTISQSY